jgi:hypothetical protein
MSLEYKKVSFGGGDTHYVKPSELTKGYAIEGQFVKTLTNEFGDTYIINTADGEVGLNSTKQLSKLMSVVSPGSMLRIVYQGKETIKKGQYKGKQAHNFEVFVAATDIPVATTTTAQAAPQPRKPNLAKVS